MKRKIVRAMSIANTNNFKVYDSTGITNGAKNCIMIFYLVLILISAFQFNSTGEIISGIGMITVSPSILISDYMVIGNIGSSLFNSGLLMIISMFIVNINKVEINGSIIAAVFTVGGFALFGKNLYNIWSIFMGVHLYSLVKKEKFSNYILIALFGTALGPMVSLVSFGLGLPIIYGIILGNIFGVIAGFIMPSLASHFSKFHQGFNLYNIGFTAGIVGTLFMSFLRAYGKDVETLSIVGEGNNLIFTIYLSTIFISMVIIGYILNGRSFDGYNNILKHSGKSCSDFVELEGFHLTMINMGVVGFIGLAYVLLVKGELNGATIGGIMTMVGFSAFGKHAKNILPIFLGMILANTTQVWDINSVGSLLAALFGTTLAPISGRYGWKIGVLAGFIHMTVVMNTGYLHGGMNLYNNGFAGGIVAASLVPIVDGLIKKDFVDIRQKTW